MVLLVYQRFSQAGLRFQIGGALSQSDGHFCPTIRELYGNITNPVSGNTGTMIFGNRIGKAGKKCTRKGNDEFECHVKKKSKVLLAIPQVQTMTSPSLLISETGEFAKIFSYEWRFWYHI